MKWHGIASVALLIVIVFVTGPTLTSQGMPPGTHVLRPGAKVFLKPMPDGFDESLRAAFARKKVPVTLVASRAEAEFEMSGVSESQKATAAKKVIRLDFHSDEQASISLSDTANGEVVFAYSVNKKSSRHGKQSTAEACAKHLSDEIKHHK